MVVNQDFRNNEYTMKQVIGYYILGIKLITNDTIYDYINTIEHILKMIKKENVLNYINIELIRDFPFFYNINYIELFAYAIVLFDRLMKLEKSFTEKELVAELKIIMSFYSSRTIISKANFILKNSNV